MSEITQRANSSIRNHTLFAMTAAVVPVPVADIGAITAVEIDMIRALTKIYGLKWNENIGKQAVGIAAAATTGSGIWASLIKIFPGIGTVVGGAIQMTIAGAVCYAVGKAYQKHLETGGEVFNKDTFEEEMKKHIKEGKKVAKELKKGIKEVKYCHIINCESKKAIDVTDWRNDNGAELQTWDVTKKDNQSWLFKNVNETETIIRSKFNNKVLDVKDRDMSNNAIVQLWDDFGSDNQKWIIEDSGGYRYRIKSALSNKYLTSIVCDENTKIVLQDLVESDNQKWWLEWH